MIERDVFQKRADENDGRLPLLTLDEFFSGNTAEDSIAPNDWEYGRPPISELWRRMQALEKTRTLHGFALPCTTIRKSRSLTKKSSWFLQGSPLRCVRCSKGRNWKRLRSANGSVPAGRRNGNPLNWIPFIHTGRPFRMAFIVIVLSGTDV